MGNFTNAIYNEETGVTLLAHPTEPDLYVTPSHLSKIVAGQVEEDTCVYTTETICIEWTPSPSSYSGRICTNWRTIRTCTCS